MEMKRNKMDECNSRMSAGCNVSLYRSWTVQIGLVPCWEEAVHNCTLKQNKDHQLEDTRLPLLGERMLLQIPVVQTSAPCLEVYRLGTKPNTAQHLQIHQFNACLQHMYHV